MDARVTGVSGGWSRDRGEASLSDVNRSVVVRSSGPTWRRAAAFVGPGYLVAVGYMDPGNWATSLAGGSKFGYARLVGALVSNIMAIVLQSLCARLAIASGRDLAQACRDAYPKPVALVLWFLAEVAIVATDIAEVIGTAIGLNLIFGIPLEIGVIITALDVFLILYLQTLGFRYVEALIIALLGVIAVCFGIQIALANPDWAAVIKGFAPTTEIVTNPEMLRDRHDGTRHDHLVDELGELTGAGRPNVRGAPHHLQERAGPLEDILGTAGHDGQSPFACTRLASGDGRVEIIDPPLGCQLRLTLGCRDRDRAHHD